MFCVGRIRTLFWWDDTRPRVPYSAAPACCAAYLASLFPDGINTCCCVVGRAAPYPGQVNPEDQAAGPGAGQSARPRQHQQNLYRSVPFLSIWQGQCHENCSFNRRTRQSWRCKVVWHLFPCYGSTYILGKYYKNRFFCSVWFLHT